MTHSRTALAFFLAFGLVTVAVALATKPAPAQSEQIPCATADQALERLNRLLPIESTATLDADQTLRVVAWYNSLPPVTDRAYDLVIVIRHPANIGLLLMREGCVANAELLKPEQVEGLFGAILGGDPA